VDVVTETGLMFAGTGVCAEEGRRERGWAKGVDAFPRSRSRSRSLEWSEEDPSSEEVKSRASRIEVRGIYRSARASCRKVISLCPLRAQA